MAARFDLAFPECLFIVLVNVALLVVEKEALVGNVSLCLVLLRKNVNMVNLCPALPFFFIH